MSRIWSFFSSTMLTIVLAIFICADAIWGSILTVGGRDFYTRLDHAVLLPELIKTGSHNLSYTLWIYILIVLITLFAINTFICTTDRVVSILRNKSPWQSFLPHTVHIGFLIALLGHLLGSAYGFKSTDNFLMVGDSIAVPHNPTLRLKLNGVEVDTSPDGRSIEQLHSAVTLYEGDRMVAHGDIEINSPLLYKGIAFYHMDHGQMPGGLLLDINGVSKEVAFNSYFNGPNGGKFTLGDIIPDYVRDTNDRVYSRSSNFNNPYQEIISTAGERVYLNLSEQGSEVVIDGVKVVLKDFVIKKYAVLSINRDPSIHFIMLGSIVLTFGIILIFIFRGGRAELMRRKRFETT